MLSTESKLLISNRALRMIGAKPITAFGETTSSEGKAINACYNDVRDGLLAEHPWSFAQKRVVLVDMTRTAQDDWVTATVYAVDDIVYDPTLTKYYKCLIAHTAGALFATDLAAAKWELYTDWLTATVYAKGAKVYNSGVEYSCLINHTSGTFSTDLTAVKWVATETVHMTDDNLDIIYYLPTDFIKPTYTSEANALIQVEGNRLLSDTAGLKIKYTYSNDDPTQYFPLFVDALVMRLASELCFQLTESVNKAAELKKLYLTVDLPNACAADSQQGSADEARQDQWENERRGYASELLPGTGVWHPIS